VHIGFGVVELAKWARSDTVHRRRLEVLGCTLVESRILYKVVKQTGRTDLEGPGNIFLLGGFGKEDSDTLKLVLLVPNVVLFHVYQRL
jgi:hypothetical protein